MLPSVLAVEGLAKSFQGTVAVVDVSFEIQVGEIFGLLGPNGAGKTTTLSLICGLLKPDSGTVTVNGKDFAADPTAAQRALGVVPQEIALYEELTAEENLLFWGRLSGLSGKMAAERALEVLEELSLSERRKEPIRNYSGGMKRRLNIGAALLHAPKLLLLDEPTVGIDPQARANILEYVRQLAAQGTSVLYTTHYLEEAEALCDRIGIIDQGRLLAADPLKELQERLGGDRLFVLEGDFSTATPQRCNGFLDRFQMLTQSPRQWVISAPGDRTSPDCLRELLNLPIEIDNITVKKPNLNDVFLQLTGRELRE